MSDVHQPWAGECDNSLCHGNVLQPSHFQGNLREKRGCWSTEKLRGDLESFQIESVSSVCWKSDRLKTQVKSNMTFEARRISCKPISFARYPIIQLFYFTCTEGNQQFEVDWPRRDQIRSVQAGLKQLLTYLLWAADLLKNRSSSLNSPHVCLWSWHQRKSY